VAIAPQPPRGGELCRECVGMWSVWACGCVCLRVLCLLVSATRRRTAEHLIQGREGGT
jgi:hypothetical protein